MKLPEIDLKDFGAWPIQIKAVATALVAIIAAAGFWYFLIIDIENTISAKQAEEGVLKESFEVKQRKASQLKDYRGQYDEIQMSLDGVIKQLPTSAEIAFLLTDISTAGKSNGLNFELFKPMPKIAQDFYSIHPIEIKVTGSFNEIASFVSEIAAMPRIVTIHNISIKQSVDYIKSNKLTMDATIKTYSENEDSKEKNKLKNKKAGE